MNELTIKEWSVPEIKEQVGKVQTLLKEVLADGHHYGTIPGTDKPSLLKPGAEKLCLMFRLAPKYEIKSIEYDNSHIGYEITCSLHQIGSNNFWGQGVGSCSTLESKYRYRNDYEDTGRAPTKAYWDSGKNGQPRNIELIGGKGHVTKKDDNGAWKIYKTSGKIETPDIADQYNTVLKMAKKRAMVDATITATGASDIFTQDMEDFTSMVEPTEKVTAGSVISFKNTNLTDQEVFEALKEIPDEIRDRMTTVVNAKQKTKKEVTQIAVDCEFDAVKILEELNKLDPVAV